MYFQPLTSQTTAPQSLNHWTGWAAIITTALLPFIPFLSSMRLWLPGRGLNVLLEQLKEFFQSSSRAHCAYFQDIFILFFAPFSSNRILFVSSTVMCPVISLHKQFLKSSERSQANFFFFCKLVLWHVNWCTCLICSVLRWDNVSK